jgi:hypothetical protein
MTQQLINPEGTEFLIQCLLFVVPVFIIKNLVFEMTIHDKGSNGGATI